MPFFSIIIPSYNPNIDYFKQCINSILKQDFTDFEILVVINNATDATTSSIKTIAKLDKRILPIYSCSGGISNARNYGIKKANGEYIVFIDDDDLIINSSYLSQCYDSLHNNNTDLVIFNYTEKDPANIIERELKRTIILEEDVKNSFFTTYNFYGIEIRSVWSKAFKKNIIQFNNVQFDATIKSGGEDALFMLEYAKYTSKAEIFNTSAYYHRLHSSSTTFRYNSNSGPEYNYYIKKYLQITNNFIINDKQPFFVFCDQIFYNIIITDICNPKNTFKAYKRARKLSKICRLPYINQSIKTIKTKQMRTIKKMAILFLLKIHAYLAIVIILDRRYRH